MLAPHSCLTARSGKTTEFTRVSKFESCIQKRQLSWLARTLLSLHASRERTAVLS
jgi:hypothetical protein